MRSFDQNLIERALIRENLWYALNHPKMFDPNELKQRLDLLDEPELEEMQLAEERLQKSA